MVTADQRMQARAAIRRLEHDGGVFTPDPSDASLYEVVLHGDLHLERPRMGRGEQSPHRMQGMALTLLIVQD